MDSGMASGLVCTLTPSVDDALEPAILASTVQRCHARNLNWNPNLGPEATFLVNQTLEKISYIILKDRISSRSDAPKKFPQGKPSLTSIGENR